MKGLVFPGLVNIGYHFRNYDYEGEEAFMRRSEDHIGRTMALSRQSCSTSPGKVAIVKDFMHRARDKECTSKFTDTQNRGYEAVNSLQYALPPGEMSEKSAILYVVVVSIGHKRWHCTNKSHQFLNEQV